MARGFTLQDISCLTLDGGADMSPAPSSSMSPSMAATDRQGHQHHRQPQQQPRPGSSVPQQEQHPTRKFVSDKGNSNNNNNNNKTNDTSLSSSSAGGLFASGLNWFDRQRETRRREYLKQEAEKQLLKIGEAQRAAHRETTNATGGGVIGATVDRNQSLVDSSSSSSSSSTSSSSAASVSQQQQQQQQQQQHTEGSSSSIGRCAMGLVSNRSNVSAGSSVATTDPGTDGFGGDCNSNCSTSSNNNNNYNKTFSRQRNNMHFRSSSSFGTSTSKSGEGASVMLDLSDIGLGDDAEDGFPETGAAQSTKDRGTNNSGNGNNHNHNTTTENEAREEEDSLPPVRVTEVEGDDASPYILSQNQMNEIARHVLPETITYCRWRRLYGLGRDGDSFDGCLRLIGSTKRTLMVVRTTKGDVFGGYADAPWHSRRDSSAAKFYGSASSCLYTFSSETTKAKTNAATKTKTKPQTTEQRSPIRVYRWTGKNRYIQVCDVSGKMLAFGGGGDKGAFGLCLQEDFQRGTTGHCDTFDNDPLSSGCEQTTTTFDIVDVEFWEFLTGVF